MRNPDRYGRPLEFPTAPEITDIASGGVGAVRERSLPVVA